LDRRRGVPSRRVALLLVLPLVAACGRWSRPASRTAVAGSAVGLVAEGSAFDRPSVREAVVRALEQTSGRHVIVLAGLVEPHNPDAMALVARVRKAEPALRTSESREPRCRDEAAVLTALVRHVDAVYRVTVDRSERARPRAATEESPHGRVAGAVLGALRLAARGKVREESVAGSVVVTTFGATGGVRRVPVSRTLVSIEPTVLTDRLDAAAVVADALRTVPPPPAPAWNAVAARLITARCPFLALAVHQAQIAPARPDIRRRALAAARPPSRRHAPAATVPSPAPAEEPATPTPDDRYSCTNLCRMHMVEICNQDKVLWDANRKRWEPTPCGSMREDAFLQDCYRQQWLSGAFHESCVEPCEQASEGRDRLLGILQTAGCLRPRSS
jgi:hypothetical protein